MTAFLEIMLKSFFHMMSYDFIYLISWYNMTFAPNVFGPFAKDNIEALSLALFVECFIGENLGSAVSGGFVMFSGQVPGSVEGKPNERCQ